MNEKEMAQIVQEERVRLQIRQELQSVASPAVDSGAVAVIHQRAGWRKEVLDFLNSSVGTWLLSSVVLTGGAALIQQIQHQHEVSEQNHQQLVVHAFEIQNRLDNMEFALKRVSTVGDARRALQGLYKSIYPLSKELENRSLNSLYFTVYNLFADSRKKGAEEAIELVRQLEDLEMILQSRSSDQALTAEDRAQLAKLIKDCKAVQSDIDVVRKK